MATAPITYDTFFTIFLYKEVSFLSTIRTIRDFATRRGLQSKAAMTTIVMAMIYVLAWPTLASAMTGYTATSRSVVTDRQQNFIGFESFTQVAYIIHDGWRINLDGDFIVPFDEITSKHGAMNLRMLFISWRPTNKQTGEPIVRQSDGRVSNTNCDVSDSLSNWNDMCFLSRNVSQCASRFKHLQIGCWMLIAHPQ
jgi:hypothetical protein